MRAPSFSPFTGNFVAGRTAVLVIAAALLWSGCDFVDDDAPGVIAVEVVPSTITVDEISSAPQEHFTIEISTENFTDEITDANAFIGEEERDALPPGEVVINDNVVNLEGILNHWFQGYDPGIYDIGVEIESETAFAREFNRATVEITDE